MKRSEILTASGAVVVVLSYVCVSLLHVLPSNPVTDALSPVVSATRPYLSQQWNVFAPGIQRSNPELRVQAQWIEDGERVHSDWVSVTELEFEAVEGRPLPSRIAKSSYNAINNYVSRYRSLTPEQQERARDTFVERRGEGFGPIPTESLTEELAGLGGQRGDVVRFLRYDEIMREYMTTFATAYFGEDVFRVRWQLYRTRPNDFDRRAEEVLQHEPTWITFGWRHPAEVRPETLTVFGDVIDRYGESR